MDGGGEDTGGVAGGGGAGGWGFFEDAAEAGAGRKKCRSHAVGADGAAVDEGDCVLDGEVVEEVAGFEVVGAVEDEVGLGVAEGLLGVGGGEVANEGIDGDFGVDVREAGSGGLGFGEGLTGVIFGEEGLALEIGPLDQVAVEDGEVADASSCELVGSGAAEGADADDEDAALGYSLLAGFAEVR